MGEAGTCSLQKELGVPVTVDLKEVGDLEGVAARVEGHRMRVVGLYEVADQVGRDVGLKAAPKGVAAQEGGSYVEGVDQVVDGK